MSNLLSQASLVMIPSGYKEDIVYSPVPTNGNGDLSFTRASNGTRINSAGLVEVVPWNLLEQSNAFTTSPWSFVGTPTLTANYAANPLTGANDAWRFQSASGGERIVNSVAGAFNTFSVYAKGTGTIQIRDSSGTYYIDVALTSSWQRISVYIPATFTNVQILSNGGCDATIWGAQLNIGATAKPYFPTTDRLNVPRLTYQNGGGGCPSLLLEKQSTNLCLWSDAMATSPWQDFGGLQFNNNTISPDGTQNASKLEYDGSIIGCYQTISVTSGATYTATMYAKLDTATNICLVINNSAAWNTVGGISFTTSNGLIANQWARVQFTFTAPATGQINIHIGGHSETGVTPQSIGSCFIWGVQVEESSYPTSVINTTSSSATRVADACFKTGISSLIGQTEGVVFWDIQVETLSATGNENLLNIDNGTGFGETIYFAKSTTGNLSAEVYVSAVAQCSFTYSLPSVGRYKMALAYKANDFAFYVNGVSRGTDSSGSVPTCSRLQMGNGALGSSDGKVNQAILFPTRLTNAELASLTTI